MFDPESLTTIDRDYRKDDSGGRVKLIQEWLSLHGLGLVLDGSFGPATENAVKAFQSRNQLPVDGVVKASTFAALAGPMTDALKPISLPNSSIGARVAAHARQHLARHPRELGGRNLGPWVRLYMKGNEGPNWPWCAGFACCMLERACSAPDTTVPIASSFSSSELATRAHEAGMLVKGSNPADKRRVGPGSFFLVPETGTRYKHVGIVESIDGEVFRTIEGNTNDEGTHNGYEVCSNLRTFARYDFISI
jgi:hypothetical protein